MNCNFYSISDDRNKINKTLGTPTTKTITFLDSVDLLHPIIKLSAFPAEKNYCYIPALNRYYFIDSVEIVRNGLFVVRLSIDVLYTYKTQIETSTADIVETSEILNADKLDYESENTETVTEIDLTNPFNDTSNILITAQGGV